MTREEEIREAIDKTFPCTNGGRCYEQALGASGFELGVKWADSHPINAWHDASEEPKHGEDIIAICDTIPVAGGIHKKFAWQGYFPISLLAM